MNLCISGQVISISNYIVSSDLIRIRRTLPEDLDYVIATEQHADNVIYITPWTREQHKSALESEDVLHLILEDHLANSVGYMILRGFSNEHQCIEFMRIVISDKGKGYGRDAIRLIQTYVFNELHAHRLWLDVKEHNHRAKNLYESLGFRYEGMLRECIKSGDTYESLIIMAILRREFAN